MLSDILGSLLQQLLRRGEHMSNGISALHERCNDGKRRPTSGELSSLLRSESRFFQKFFIIIDALDECPSVDDTKSKFLLEIQKLLPTPQLLVTSRPHLKSVVAHFLPDAIRLEIRAHDEDIRKYLDEQVKKKDCLSLLVEDRPALRETIKNKITEKAKGMLVTQSPFSHFF
jgi:hypothetical protein